MASTSRPCGLRPMPARRAPITTSTACPSPARGLQCPSAQTGSARFRYARASDHRRTSRAFRRRSRGAGRAVVHAAERGVVSFIGTEPRGYGKYVVIRHDGGYASYYAHLSAFEPTLRTGMRVARGQRVGAVGSTGTATGPHLHFEVRRHARLVDPVALAGGQGSEAEGRTACCVQSRGSRCTHAPASAGGRSRWRSRSLPDRGPVDGWRDASPALAGGIAHVPLRARAGNDARRIIVRSSITSIVRRHCTANPSPNGVKFADCFNSSSLLSRFARDSANSTALLFPLASAPFAQRLPQRSSAPHSVISQSEINIADFRYHPFRSCDYFNAGDITRFAHRFAAITSPINASGTMKRTTRNLGLGGMAILTGAMPVGACACTPATPPGSGMTVTCSGAGIPSVVAATGSTTVTINLDSTAHRSYAVTSTPTPFSSIPRARSPTTATCRCPATARAWQTARGADRREQRQHDHQRRERRSRPAAPTTTGWPRTATTTRLSTTARSRPPATMPTG